VTGPPDAYKTLQVDPEAEDEVIVAAYRRLARKYHPDTAANDADAAARMAAINTAWEQIGTPAKREAYDRERAELAARAGPAAPAARTADPASGGATTSPATPPPTATRPEPPRPEPESVSRDWTTGRSTMGGGYDASMRTADGTGAAGPPPGNASGSVVTFGRYTGWSVAEIGRADLDYLEWLDRMPIGRPYRDEIDSILRRAGRRQSAQDDATDRRGLFRRR
jgi:curved DNA-binding protein CbpA